MKVIFHVVLPTGEECAEIQEIAGMEFGHPRIYFIRKYPTTPDSNDYKGYVAEGRVGNRVLYYDNHLFSNQSKPELIGTLKGYVVLRDEPEPRANILDRIAELEKGMLIKTKEIAILKARVDELRPPARMRRYACHGCGIECTAWAMETEDIETKCPHAIWEDDGE